MLLSPPGRPSEWAVPLVELERCEDLTQLPDFLREHGLSEPFPAQRGQVAVALLLGAAACAELADVPAGPASPVAVPAVVAVACRPGRGDQVAEARADVGEWTTTWGDDEHALAVERVRELIAAGELYQANVVGHRTAAYAGDARVLARRVAGLPGASYAGVLSGQGWAVGCGSPESLVRVEGGRVTTAPVKGTRVITPGSDRELRDSRKDRAEHVMIVDLARNDLARVARTGTVEVEQLYALTAWSGLWHAASQVGAELEDGIGVLDVLRAVAPGGSVTGAPKRAACAALARLEPVGRGPSTGAFGLLWPGGLDLGLTIRTVALADGLAHLWAGGGITWGSDPDQEVAEAHAKAAPVRRALAG